MNLHAAGVEAIVSIVNSDVQGPWMQAVTSSDEPEFAAVADALDSVNTISVQIFRNDFSLSNPLLRTDQKLRPVEDFPISQRFELIAAGTAVREGQAVAVVAHVFE